MYVALLHFFPMPTGNFRGNPEANNNEPEHIMTHHQRQLHAKTPATEHPLHVHVCLHTQPWTVHCARTIRTATEIAQYEAAVDIANAPGIPHPHHPYPAGGERRAMSTTTHRLYHSSPLSRCARRVSRPKTSWNQRAPALIWGPGGSHDKEAGRDKAGIPRRPTEEKTTETQMLPNQRKPSDATPTKPTDWGTGRLPRLSLRCDESTQGFLKLPTWHQHKGRGKLWERRTRE